MTTFLTPGGGGIGGGPAPSTDTRALQAINSQNKTFVNKDFVKNIAWLNNSVDTLSAWSQKLQAGVDQSNQNAIEQIQGIFSDFFVMFAGLEPTGLDPGDLKYIIQGIGALLGINPDTPFPFNLVSAVGHLFDTYLMPLPQMTDMVLDTLAAWAEALGFTDEAVDSIEEFANAIVTTYNDWNDVAESLQQGLMELFKMLGLGSNFLSLNWLADLWTELSDLINTYLGGPRQALLNTLSQVVVLLFKSLTWLVRMIDPYTITTALGLDALGPQLATPVSNDMQDWFLDTDPVTGWVWDATVSYSGGGSFKTSGSANNKTLNPQSSSVCGPDDILILSGWISWDNVPADQNEFGLIVSWYNQGAFVSSHNINIPAGHGAHGGWQQIGERVPVPVGVDSFRLGCRTTYHINTGNIWVDGLSATKQSSLGLSIYNILQQFLPSKIWNTFVDALVGIEGAAFDAFINIMLTIKNIVYGLLDITGKIFPSLIPSLDASKITTGQFIDSLIPPLNAAKITTGQFLSSLIPNLPATIINTGTFISSLIPPLDAAKIITGQFLSSLIPNLDASIITSGKFPAAAIPNITISMSTDLAAVTTNIQNTWDTAWNAVFPGITPPADQLTRFEQAIQSIGSQITTAVSKLEPIQAFLNIRDNLPIHFGLGPTSEVVVPVSMLGSGAQPTNFNVTASTPTMGFIRCGASALKKVIIWHGAGKTNLTEFYISIYKMDTATGNLTRIHTSANIINDVSAGWNWNVYNIPNGIMAQVSDVFGIELRVVGTGLHTIAGTDLQWMVDYPSYPKRYGACRNSTAAPPDTIASASVQYSRYAPAFEFAMSALDIPSVEMPPELQQLTTPGDYSVEIHPWAVYLDLFGLGAGGAGGSGNHYGIPVWVSGDNGYNAVWNSTRLTRGVDIPWDTTILNVHVAAATGATPGGGYNGAGGDSTRFRAVGWAGLDCLGGGGGAAFQGINSANWSRGAVGNFEYPSGSGIYYLGGYGGQSAGAGSPNGMFGASGYWGSSPGGGGGGGNTGGSWPISGGNGGGGGAGVAYVCQRQS